MLSGFRVRPILREYRNPGAYLKGHIRLGAAWQHEGVEDFNVQIDVLPIDGRIVLRTPKADDEKSE